MQTVSQEFLDAIAADVRRVRGRVTIDFTDPFIDQSLTISTSEDARISWPGQVADALTDPGGKWASLDGSWVLDGTYSLMPDTQEDADRYQVGWWGSQLAEVDGTFAGANPTLTVQHTPRPIRSLLVVGDSERGEYPVDFTIRLYDDTDMLLHTEPVTDNDQVVWTDAITPVVGVAKQELEIEKWSEAGRQVKVLEFFTSIQETYEGDDLLLVSLLEERETGRGELPVGSISANEITVRINNIDRRFDPGNLASPLHGLVKANRRIRAWLGVQLWREVE